MEQHCTRCGYISDRPARFCRQCGTQLFAETEMSSANTRNYTPPMPAQSEGYQPGQSQYTYHQPGMAYRAEDTSPETARMYQAPVVAGYAMPQAQPQPKSRIGIWILVGILSVLFVGAGLGAFFIAAVRRSESVAVGSNEGDHRRQIREALDRAMEEAKRHQEEAMRQAEEAAQGIPAPPPPPGAPVPTSTQLEKYRYPKAQIRQTVNLAGNEFLQMTTDDAAEKVVEFYKKKFGAPSIQNQDDDGMTAIFQIPGVPSVWLAVSPDEENEGKTQVIVSRLPFSIPKFR